MANISFDAASGLITDTDGSSLTIQHIIGNGNNRVLIVGASTESSTGGNTVVSGVTYNGVALTKLVHESNAGGGSESAKTIRTEYWYGLENILPNPGAYNIVITWAGTVDVPSGVAVSLFDVKQAAPEASAHTTTSNGGGAQTISTSVISVTDLAWVVGVAASQNNGNYTPGTGVTERADITVAGDGHNITIGTFPTTTAGSQTFAETNSNGERQNLIIASFASGPDVNPNDYAFLM